eukprot:14389700-Ditylum_brightwellii.AAC.2
MQPWSSSNSQGSLWQSGTATFHRHLTMSKQQSASPLIEQVYHSSSPEMTKFPEMGGLPLQYQ